MRALVIVLALTGCEKLVTYEPPPEKRVADVEHQSFDEAKALAAKGDVLGAHAKLTQVKDDSPLCSSPEFVDIENRWAKLQLEAADKEHERAKKLALLQPVAAAVHVGAELRAAANQKVVDATPDPALPPPEYGYDRPAAVARVQKARELLDTNKAKDARDLLMPAVASRNCAPEEIDLLIAACTALKDEKCASAFMDAGVGARPEKPKAPGVKGR